MPALQSVTPFVSSGLLVDEQDVDVGLGPGPQQQRLRPLLLPNVVGKGGLGEVITSIAELEREGCVLGVSRGDSFYTWEVAPTAEMS